MFKSIRFQPILPISNLPLKNILSRHFLLIIALGFFVSHSGVAQEVTLPSGEKTVFTRAMDDAKNRNQYLVLIIGREDCTGCVLLDKILKDSLSLSSKSPLLTSVRRYHFVKFDAKNERGLIALTRDLDISANIFPTAVILNPIDTSGKIYYVVDGDATSSLEDFMTDLNTHAVHAGRKLR